MRVTAVGIMLAAALLAPGAAGAETKGAGLAAPERFSVKQSDENSFVMRWKAVEGADGYLTEIRSLRTGGVRKGKVRNPKSGGWVTVKEGRLRCGEEYEFKVAAYAGRKTGKVSSARKATKAIMPEAVKIKVAEKGDSYVRLTWTKSKYADGYVASEIIGGKVKVLMTVKGRSVKISGLKGGTHAFAVRPYRKRGLSTRRGPRSAVKVSVKGDEFERLVKTVDDGNVYDGGGDPNRRYSKAQAEAYANRGNAGRPFSSRTGRFLWLNRRSYRLFVFVRRSGVWRLEHEWPCVIGRSSNKTMSGTYVLRRMAVRHDYGYNYAVYVTSYAGANAIHSLLYPSQPDYLAAGYQASLGCVRVVSSAAKFIYENCHGATLAVR